MDENLKLVVEIMLLYSEKDRRRLQLNSMYNFIIYYSKLVQVCKEDEVKELIEDYLKTIAKGDFEINNRFCKMLAFTYTAKIGHYYRQYLGFKFYDSNILIPVIQGLIIDLIFFYKCGRLLFCQFFQSHFCYIGLT